MTEIQPMVASDDLPERSFNGDDRWLDATWRALPTLWREIVSLRSNGETLSSVGQRLELSRERVRQIERKVTESLVDAQEFSNPELSNKLLDGVFGKSAVTEHEIERITGIHQTLARDLLLSGLGLERPATHYSVPAIFWTFERTLLDDQLRALASAAPFTIREAKSAASHIGIPIAVNWESILGGPNGVLTETEFGWARTNKQRRDMAYLWLLNESEPRSTSEVSRAIGADEEHAVREMMRRDSRFVQLRPERTWALADWHHLNTQHRYRSALEVVIEILRDIGPMTLDRLEHECILRYPVSGWRIRQCLSSNLIGLDEHGLIDLTERGALRIEEPEPKRSQNIQVQGNVIGVSQTVNHNLLRGSGLPVNRWLSWYLGLRSAPSARYFQLPDPFGEFVVRRSLGMSQISSLRQVANAMHLSEGCSITVLIHTDTDTADVVHTCRSVECPALSPVFRLSQVKVNFAG